jgi:predicted HAD superfamily phosphohydrolase YqeG
LLELPYLARGHKPLPRSFIKAAQVLNTSPSETAVVGDQIFTDILGGRIAKMHCVYVEPIEMEKGVFFRFKRLMERLLFKIF